MLPPFASFYLCLYKIVETTAFHTVNKDRLNFLKGIGLRLTSVLGIDAAWTNKQQSGVALVTRKNGYWKLNALAASYSEFLGDSPVSTPVGKRSDERLPDPHRLLSSAKRQSGSPIDVVAIDMPLSYEPITRRRTSDDAVSVAYGARKCGTHSPSAERPGSISDNLRLGFERIGYPLLTKAVTLLGVIETYPHPALVELADAPERLRYKVGRIRNYWPNLPPIARRTRLIEEWVRIITLLESRISGLESKLQPPKAESRTSELKAYEDMLDAVVCAWVGICAIEGRAKPFGDETSAIWLPNGISIECCPQFN